MLTTLNEITARYEEQRRTKMLRKVLALDVGSTGLAFVALAIFHQTLSPYSALRTPIGVSEILLLVISVTLSGALFSMRQRKTPFAYWSAVVMSVIGPPSAPMIWAAVHGIDDMVLLETIPFCMGILHLAMFGSRPAIIRFTLLINVLTVLTYSVIPVLFHQHVTIDVSVLSVVTLNLLYEWTYAGLMILIWNSFQAMLSDIGTAYHHVQRLDILKDDFITHINHELRTPLTALMTYIETLAEGFQHISPERMLMGVTSARDVGNGLVALLQRILDHQHPENFVQDLAPAPVNLDEIVHEAIRMIDMSGDPSLMGHPLQMDIPTGLTVQVDPVRMREVLVNLLTNAVKYSADETPIEIHASIVSHTSWRHALQQTPQQVQLSVRDRGFGIPPEEQAFIFQRYVRLNRDRASSIQGSGIGLYVVKSIVEAMSGVIQVESTGVEGDGTTFYLYLPHGDQTDRQERSNAA